MLRATEIDNTNKNVLITSAGQLGTTLDSATVQSVPMKFFETLDSLPLTNLSIGLQAFVQENRKHYVSNGSGWYNTGYSIGASPYWDSDPLSTYEIVDSATPLIVIAKPQDSDNPNLINQSFGSDSALYMATISNDSSVFTFTPKTKTQIRDAVTAGNLTDSYGDFVYTFKWSDGINFVAKSVTIGYSPASSPVTISNYTGDRALVGGRTTAADGGSGTNYSQIQYFTISTTGNSGTFGDLNNVTARRSDTVSDSTTAVFIGTNSTTIEYKTFATSGDASLWSGTMPTSYMGVNGGQFSDGIWGITYKASNSSEYITFASQGNAQSFGDTPIYGYNAQPGANDPTRGLRIAGGGYNTDAIEYLTLQTLNSATDFGSNMITQNWYLGAALADETRAVAAGGYSGSSTAVSRMEYLTVQVPSNSTSFGNLTQARSGLQGTSNGTRGVWIAGETKSGYPKTYVNKMDYITIATTSNAYNFGSASTGSVGGAASGN